MTDRLDLRRRLHQVAFTQHGYFTASQAKSVGYTYQAQKYHVDRGNWLRVDRALFRLAEWPTSSDDAFVRWWVWSEGRGVLSHQSAAEAHGLGKLDPTRVHLTMPIGVTTGNSLVSIHNFTLTADDIESRSGFAVTTPTRTVLDLASVEITQEQLVAAIAASLRAGSLRSRTLRQRMDAFGSHAALRLERALATVEGDS
ncbi:hypothetical protein [Rhodococcus sp. NPDC057529]|uniref:type IV toxin-antitoxin system AbiEi family antitoxin domain-containing protein n=1 Tax=Rhodococcus sp. NPDC057529 TaxID=3346158 RepID=UPI00366A63B5